MGKTFLETVIKNNRVSFNVESEDIEKYLKEAINSITQLNINAEIIINQEFNAVELSLSEEDEITLCNKMNEITLDKRLIIGELLSKLCGLDKSIIDIEVIVESGDDVIYAEFPIDYIMNLQSKNNLNSLSKGLSSREYGCISISRDVISKYVSDEIGKILNKNIEISVELHEEIDSSYISIEEFSESEIDMLKKTLEVPISEFNLAGNLLAHSLNLQAEEVVVFVNTDDDSIMYVELPLKIFL